MELTKAVETYTILTVGEGLVTAIPALLVSMSGGLITTRAASESNLGEEVATQLFARSRPLAVAASVLVALALIPGLPKLSFLLVAGVLGTAAYVNRKPAVDAATERRRRPGRLRRRNRRHAGRPGVGGYSGRSVTAHRRGDRRREAGRSAPQPRAGRSANRFAGEDRTAGAVGACVRQPAAGSADVLDRRERVEVAARRVSSPIACWRSIPAPPRSRSRSRARRRANLCSACRPGPSGRTSAMARLRPAIATARRSGDGALDASSPRRSGRFCRTCSRASRRRTLPSTRVGQSTNPKLIEELIPKLVSVGEVQRVLRQLLRERVPVKDLTSILEAIADAATVSKDPDVLTEAVRTALGEDHPARTYQSDAVATCRVIALSTPLEEELVGSLTRTDRGTVMAVDPGKAQGLASRLAEILAAEVAQPVLLCTPALRPHLWRLGSARALPHVAVLSSQRAAAPGASGLGGFTGLICSSSDSCVQPCEKPRQPPARLSVRMPSCCRPSWSRHRAGAAGPAHRMVAALTAAASTARCRAPRPSAWRPPVPRSRLTRAPSSQPISWKPAWPRTSPRRLSAA